MHPATHWLSAISSGNLDKNFLSYLDTPWGMRLEPYQAKLTVKAPDQARASKIPIDAFLIHEILTAIL